MACRFFKRRWHIILGTCIPSVAPHIRVPLCRTAVVVRITVLFLDNSFISVWVCWRRVPQHHAIRRWDFLLCRVLSQASQVPPAFLSGEYSQEPRQKNHSTQDAENNSHHPHTCAAGSLRRPCWRWPPTVPVGRRRGRCLEQRSCVVGATQNLEVVRTLVARIESLRKQEARIRECKRVANVCERVMH